MRILLVSGDMPFPGEPGSPRAYNFARQLSTRHEITLLCVSEDSGNLADAAKYKSDQSPFSSVATVTVVPHLSPVAFKLLNALSGNPWFVTHRKCRKRHRIVVNTLKDLCSKADLVWAHGLPMLQYVEGCGLPVVLDAVDYASRKEFASARMQASRFMRCVDYLRASLTRRYEKTHLREPDAVVLISDVEAPLMEHEIGVPTSVVPNGCDTKFFAPSANIPSLPGNPALVFVGDFAYEPNRDAATYILDNLSHHLMKVFPETKIYLVGRLSPAAFEHVPEFVEVTGFVEDVRKYYGGADVFICPLRVGGGVKNKVLEAAAMECAIVSSEIGVEGIQFVDGVHFLKASTTTEFAEGVTRVLSDGGSYGRFLGRNARAVVEEEYSWESAGRKLESVFIKAMTRHEARASAD